MWFASRCTAPARNLTTSFCAIKFHPFSVFPRASDRASESSSPFQSSPPCQIRRSASPTPLPRPEPTLRRQCSKFSLQYLLFKPEATIPAQSATALMVHLTTLARANASAQLLSSPRQATPSTLNPSTVTKRYRADGPPHYPCQDESPPPDFFRCHHRARQTQPRLDNLQNQHRVALRHCRTPQAPTNSVHITDMKPRGDDSFPCESPQIVTNEQFRNQRKQLVLWKWRRTCS